MIPEKTYPEERLIRITELIQKNRTVNVEDLARLFGVTGATIRADLRTLESRGLVARTHGGAILRELMDSHLKMDKDPAYQNRLSHMQAEKTAIGAVCAAYIAGEDCFILDDGTTTLQVARHLIADHSITIITNGLTICSELVRLPQVHLICTGGTLMRDDLAFNGHAAEETVSRYHTSVAVLGASGLTLKQGLTAPDEQRAELKKRMIGNAIKTVILADHTKLTRVSLVPVCEIDLVDVLITDNGAPEELLDEYRARGIEVIVAQAKN